RRRVEPYGRVGRVRHAGHARGEGDDDVLDTHAEVPGQVDPRLDGEAHPGLDRRLGALDHVGRLVRRQADAVTRAVHEVLAEPGVVDDGTGRAVHVLAGGSRPDGVDGRLLGGTDDVVHLLLAVGQ